MSEREQVINADSGLSDHENPCEIDKSAQEIQSGLLPKKSSAKYMREYEKFSEWMRGKSIKLITEGVLLVYFNHLAKSLKPSSLWARYSMLRTTIDMNHNINIRNYSKLIKFLNIQSKGFISKKSEILPGEQVAQFLIDAPDRDYLATKVATIFGIQGACRREELCNMTVADVIDKQDILLVKIPKTKNDKPRQFIVPAEFYDICKKYMNSRPSDTKTTRFFLGYRNGKSTNQVMGINTFGAMPKVIAKYLNLPNVENYTGHCFRRSSATLLVDGGADILTLKRHGGWKSTEVAERYVESSLLSKRKIAEQISSGILNQSRTFPSASTSAGCSVDSTEKKRKASVEIPLGGFKQPRISTGLGTHFVREVTDISTLGNSEGMQSKSTGSGDDSILSERESVGDDKENHVDLKPIAAYPQGFHVHLNNCSNFSFVFSDKE